MRIKTEYSARGFTLIEIIVTVVMVAVFSAMMITLFSDSLIKSSDPVNRLRKSSDLSRIMANITADYIPYPKRKPSTYYAVDNKVLPVEMNGRFYICTGSGTSGVSEPVWHDYGVTYDGGVTWKAGVWTSSNAPYEEDDIVIRAKPNGHFYRCITTGGCSTEPDWTSTVYDGSTEWIRLLGYLNFQIGTADSTEKNNSYGRYYVVLNRFVKFDSSNIIQPITSGEAENILQVKIKNDEGETLSALFTVREE